MSVTDLKKHTRVLEYSIDPQFMPLRMTSQAPELSMCRC